MTQRREAMPCLSGASAHWDAGGGKVRYFANFEGTDEWIEVPGEDFSRLTQLFAQMTIDVICDAITSTLDRVNAATEEFVTFRKAVEEMYERQRATPRDEGNKN